MTHLDHCRAKKCRAPIRWFFTANGARMAVDRDPISHEEAYAEPRGVFYLDERDRLTSWAPGLLLPVDHDLWRTHWDTCRDPDEIRGRGGGAAT